MRKEYVSNREHMQPIRYELVLKCLLPNEVLGATHRCVSIDVDGVWSVARQVRRLP